MNDRHLYSKYYGTDIQFFSFENRKVVTKDIMSPVNFIFLRGSILVIHYFYYTQLVQFVSSKFFGSNMPIATASKMVREYKQTFSPISTYKGKQVFSSLYCAFRYV